jgi:hypothetical protein
MQLMSAFLSGRVDLVRFHHREHLAAAFEMLGCLSFTETALLYCSRLKAMAAAANRPDAYHETMTIGFLALVNERMTTTRVDEFSGFADANPDLLDKTCLRRWYDDDRLNSSLARRTFILPSPERGP